MRKKGAENDKKSGMEYEEPNDPDFKGILVGSDAYQRVVDTLSDWLVSLYHKVVSNLKSK